MVVCVSLWLVQWCISLNNQLVGPQLCEREREKARFPQLQRHVKIDRNTIKKKFFHSTNLGNVYLSSGAHCECAFVPCYLI